MTAGFQHRAEMLETIQDEADSECSTLTDEEESDDDMSVYSELPEEKDERSQPDDAASQAGSNDEDEWDEDEFPPLELNHEALLHIASLYVPGNHGKCKALTPLTRGTFHEILVLEFEDGWSCIGRFTRNRSEHLCVTESEFATVNYVRKHTSIPVPETYFVNFDPTHAVGAPFVLMERMEGKHLYYIWDELTLDHKLAVMTQIADVLVQLAHLIFEKIGSLNLSGEVGPLQNATIPQDEPGRGPYSTTNEWTLSFVDEENRRSAEAMEFYPYIREKVTEFLEEETDNSVLHAPYRLFHGDFDAQNMLFITSEFEPPKLSGIIDWDYSHTTPLYYLLEYPIFIRDNDDKSEDFDDNKILRQHFVQSLAQSFPKGSQDREDVREVFRQKSYLLNAFRDVFMVRLWDDPEDEKSVVESFAKGLRGELQFGDGAYGGTLFYEPDSELESDDEDEDRSGD